MPRSRLAALETSGLDARSPELLVTLGWLLLDEVPLDEAELKAARRRALLVLAAGGDPNRDLELDSVAVQRLAAELDRPERRAALHHALVALDTSGLATVCAAADLLRGNPDLAWRVFALALLADELAGE